MAIDPDTQATIDDATAFGHRLGDVVERIDRIRARRPSPAGWVMPEVDVLGRLTDLYIAPGAIARLSPEQLAGEVMASIRESTADAGRQYVLLVEDSLDDEVR